MSDRIRRIARTTRGAALAAAAAAVLAAAAPLAAQPAAPGAPPATDAAPAPAWGPGMGPPPWARQGGGPGMMMGPMMAQGPGERGPGERGPGERGWHRHGDRDGAGPMRMRGPLTGLVMPREDKALTAEEATKIAEGFLLWMGERDWKIANAVEQDGRIAFDLTTKEGSRIARFAMDRRTGRVQRIG